MDDSSTANIGKADRRIPLGMGTFAQQEREQFGQNIRLAMECIEGTSAGISKGADRSTFGLDELPVPQTTHRLFRRA